MPRAKPAGFADPMPRVLATFDDGSCKDLFDFYPDEITFGEGELVGLTEAEARALRHAKDVAHLRSKHPSIRLKSVERPTKSRLGFREHHPQTTTGRGVPLDDPSLLEADQPSLD